jgi:DMSO/TMAO reductase YedYZ molybdopterin-dependent catalytic subunit
VVFSPLHYIPSAIAAVLTVLLGLGFKRSAHKSLGAILIFFATIGLVGYLYAGNIRFYPLDFHTSHAWIGLATLLLSCYVFIDKKNSRSEGSKKHCRLGYVTASLALISLLMGLAMLSGIVVQEPSQTQPQASSQMPVSSKLPEVEATVYQGVDLTPLHLQGNNAIHGTQYINRTTYRLNVTGLVDREISWSYAELLSLPAYSEVAYMPCVEGWGFNAKWTGFRVLDLLNRSGLKPGARYAIFHTSENYSTGLPLDYLRSNNILMAYSINDVTLPPDRGFPFQLVARDKYGYKWAKWITDIEITDKETRGYWESRGYSDSAEVGTFPFEFSLTGMVAKN